MPESTTTEKSGHRVRATEASRGLLALASGLSCVILVTGGLVAWATGAALDLESIARMGTFAGIGAMGLTQFAAARRSSGENRPRPAVAAAIWTLAFAATYLTVVIA
jgi:hypothetical protein